MNRNPRLYYKLELIQCTWMSTEYYASMCSFETELENPSVTVREEQARTILS